MFQNLSLTNSTDVKITFSCYFVAFINLIFISLSLFKNISFVTDRWDENTIFILHYFILGFIIPIIFGSLAQLLPVLFGINLKNHFIFVLLSISTILTPFFFKNIFNINQSLIPPFIFALTLILFFIFLNFKNIKNKNLNAKSYYLFTAFLYFIVGIFISQIISFSYHDLLSINFRPNLTNIHAKLMLLGGIFHLIIAIASNVIPMFFVTKNIPENYLKYFFFMCNGAVILDIIFNSIITHILLFLCLTILNLYFAHLIFTRKRKIKSVSIYLWYLFFISMQVASLFYCFEINESIIGPLVFLIMIPSVIFAMLTKIIPFLLWLNLNNLQLKKLKFEIQIPTVNDFYDPFLNWIIFSLMIAISFCLFSYFNIIPALLISIAIIFLCILIISFIKFNTYKKLFT